MGDKLSDSKRFYSTEELYKIGISYYQIKQMVSRGQLKKLNKSMYENTGFNGEINDFSTVHAYIPSGIVTMLSAARYYELTTYLPDAVDVAIIRSKRVTTMPSTPSINLWFFSEKRYSTGATELKDSGSVIKIYDIEKTVVDILYYRNKVGIEETKEILINYLKRPDRDLNKLHEYARSLGCEKILSTYMEVLL